MKIKKGDNIIVISGKDKGTSGAVLRVFPSDNMVLVEGVNVVTRHQRARQRNSKGQRIEKAQPIDVSNVALVDSKTKKPARVGYQVEDGKKVRVTRPSGEKI